MWSWALWMEGWPSKCARDAPQSRGDQLEGDVERQGLSSGQMQLKLGSGEGNGDKRSSRQMEQWKFQTNGTMDTKAVVVVVVGVWEMCWVWGREKVWDRIWGRPARELYKYQYARALKFKLYIFIYLTLVTCSSFHAFWNLSCSDSFETKQCSWILI